jgi:hypothetical protein
MIIYDLNVSRSLCRPDETEAPFVVDTDAMLACAIALKCLEPIPRWYPHEVQGRCSIQLSELAARQRFNIHEASYAVSNM